MGEPEAATGVAEPVVEEEDEDLLPLVQPASASATQASTTTGPAAFGPVGRGPLGNGRVWSFEGCTWLPPVRACGRAEPGPGAGLCQHFTFMSESPARRAALRYRCSGTAVP
ncbi:hypothetical protein GCM10009738_28810 [Kitasatospora viridis]